MKVSRTLGHVALAALSMSTVTAAWPTWLPDIDSLVVRQNNNNNNGNSDSSSSATSDAPKQTTTSAGKATTGSKTTSATAKETKSGDKSDDNTTTGKGDKTTGKTTGKATATSSGDSETTHNLNTGAIATGTGAANSTNGTHTQYGVNDPAGSIVMTEPATTAGTQLYKIGDYVTWGWNYTNLQGTPTALDLLVSCSSASRTYTLTQNMTFETKGAYTWDTAAYQSANIDSPLLTQEYTLIIYDAESSISATSDPGYLGTFDNFVFGLYTPQAYTPLNDGWTCATCSGAISDMDKRVIGFALSMSVITVLSFTWFVQGLNLA